MSTPQDWAPYSDVEDAARIYLRDPALALDQLRGVVDFRAIKTFIRSRGTTSESWGDALWQEVVLTDGKRLVIWRATDEMSGEQERPTLEASLRTILLTSCTDQILTTDYEVLGDGTRRLSEVTFRLYTQLINRSHQTSATDAYFYCETFRYHKSADNGGLAQMERLMQFARIMSKHIGASGQGAVS